MTGRHAYNQQVNFNCWNPGPVDGSATIAGTLSAAGFQTRARGKMHFVPERNHLGFEHMELLADYYRHMARHPHLGRPMDHGVGQNELEPCVSTVDESNSLTRWIVERSVDFLETRDTSRPFFMWTRCSKPHPPLDPCLPYWLIYANRDVPEPAYGDWSKTPDDVPAGFRTMTWRLGNADRFSPELLRDVRRAYYALITQVDYNLGVLFSRMREMDLLDSTTIIFASDHGEMLGDHHLGAKSVFFEGSAHVPLIMKPAAGLTDGKMRGSVCDRLVCLADLYPTCLHAAGVNPPSGHSFDGRDLFEAVSGAAPRDTLIAEAHEFHCVIQGMYKYHYTSNGGAELLFDLSNDPYERHDLVRAGTHAEVLDDLRRTLIDRLSAYAHPAVKGGRLVAVNPAPQERMQRGMWPGFHSPACPSDVSH